MGITLQPARSLVAVFCSTGLPSYLQVCSFVYKHHSAILGESRGLGDFLASNRSVWSNMPVCLFQVKLASLDLPTTKNVLVWESLEHLQKERLVK